MYEISVETEFSAAHALAIGGKREPVHGHNWHVTVTLSGADLDRDGLLCDFHDVERALREITSRFHNANLNDLPPFNAGLNPSAENVARHVAERLIAALALPRAVRVESVRVTEATGCAATYRPEDPRPTPGSGGPR